MQSISDKLTTKWLIALFFAAVLLFTLGIGRTGFAGKDEHRYALVGKEILTGGDWLVMHYLGELYPDKPPVTFWTLAAGFKLAGVSPGVARGVLALYTLGALVFAWLLFAQLAPNRRVALLAFVCLMLSFRFVWAGRWLRLDMPMLTMTYGAYWATCRILFPREDQKLAGAGWVALAWLFGAGALMTKGPGVLVWLGTLVCYGLVRRERRVATAMAPWWGLPLLLLPVLAWFIPAAMQGGKEYYGAMLGTHVVERFAGEVRHGHWPLYYVPKLLSDAMPMGWLIPAALIWAWRERKSVKDRGQRTFIWCWFIFTFIFFSIPTGKRGQYILPLYPAVALLVANFLEATLQNDDLAHRARRWLTDHLKVLARALVLTALGLCIATGINFENLAETMSWGLVTLNVLILLGMAGFIWRGLQARRPMRAWLGLCTGVYLIYLLNFTVYFPQHFDDRPLLEMTATIERNAGEEMPEVMAYGLAENYALYGAWLPQMASMRSSRLRIEDLRSRKELITLLSHPGDPLASFLRDALSAKTRKRIDEVYASGTDEIDRGLTKQILREISRITRNKNRDENIPSFYTPDRFAWLELPESFESALAHPSETDNEQARLNLQALERAYPEIFDTSRDLETVRDFMKGEHEGGAPRFLIAPEELLLRYRLWSGQLPGDDLGHWPQVGGVPRTVVLLGSSTTPTH